MLEQYTPSFTTADARIIRAAIKRRIVDSTEVEDLVQETLLRAWATRSQYNGSVKWTTWLWKLAQNITFDYLRRVQRFARMHDVGADVERMAAPQPAERVELSEIIAQGLAKSPPVIREALLAVCWEGLSYKEAGARAGTIEKTMRTRVFSGRNRFKKLMGYV